MSFRQQEAVQPQPALDLLTAISGTKSLSMLDGFCRALWIDWGEGRFTDEQAQSLSEAIEARRREVRGIDRLAVRAPQVAAQARAAGRPSHFPPKRKAARSPNRRASIERRRTLAASGPMPPQLASQFTTGELAALRIVADAVRERRRLHSDLGRDRGAGRGMRHHGAERAADGRARGARHHRGAPARQAAEPRQCGAGGVAGMEDVDRARPETERRKAAPARPRGEGAKKQGPRIKIFRNLTRRPRFTRSTFPKCPSQDAKRRLAADIGFTRLRREEAFR